MQKITASATTQNELTKFQYKKNRHKGGFSKIMRKNQSSSRIEITFALGAVSIFFQFLLVRLRMPEEM